MASLSFPSSSSNGTADAAFQDPGFQAALAGMRSGERIGDTSYRIASSDACPADPTLRVRSLLPSIAKGDQTAAREVAQMIASAPDAASAEALLRAVDRRSLDRITAASVLVDSRVYEGRYGELRKGRADTRLFESLAKSVARCGNPRIKAGFVASAGAVLDHVRKSGLENDSVRDVNGRLARSMSCVIGSDVGGVIENTLLQNGRNGASDGRKSLKAYAGALIESGHAADIGAIIVSLQTGNHCDQDPMVYLNHRETRSGEPEPTYVRARVLGDWVGIAGSALQSRISDRDYKAATVSLGFTGTVDTLKELAGNAFPALKLPVSLMAAVLKPAGNKLIVDWRSELARGDREMSRNFFEAALPHHANGVQATAPWTHDLELGWLSGLQRQ